jgi:hypothetical protein
MWMVLCHAADPSAIWAYERLRSRNPDVELLPADDLSSPWTVWEHRVHSSGATVQVRLPDGRMAGSPPDGSGPTAVLNRLSTPPVGVLAAVGGTDADYALSETSAFTISWVEALAPTVVNRASTQGYCGRWRTPLHWRTLAARAGLPVVPLTLDSGEPDPAVAHPTGNDTTVLCIGGRFLADAPAEVHAAAARLSTLAQTPILGLRFDGADPAKTGWRFLDASPQPDLSAAGEAGVDALVEVLSR